MFRKRIFLGALLTLAIALPASAEVRGSFQRTLQVNGQVDLQVLTHSGDITVRTGTPGTVNISAKVHASNAWFSGSHDEQIRDIEKNPPIRQTGNLIKIDYPPYKNISIDYDITVPPDTRLRTQSGSGDQNVSGIRQGANLHTGSGDMQLDNLAGGVHVETGSGDIKGGGISGSFNGSTGSGDVRMDLSGTGDVRAHTGSGDIVLRGVNGGLQVETGSGDATVDGQITGPWMLSTGSGDVRLNLPGNANFDVDLNTSSGDLNINHPVNTTIQGRVRTQNKHHISGRVGNGGPMLKVSTGSGNITLD